MILAMKEKVKNIIFMFSEGLVIKCNIKNKGSPRE